MEIQAILEVPRCASGCAWLHDFVGHGCKKVVTAKLLNRCRRHCWGMVSLQSQGTDFPVHSSSHAGCNWVILVLRGGAACQ